MTDKEFEEKVSLFHAWYNLNCQIDEIKRVINFVKANSLQTIEELEEVVAGLDLYANRLHQELKGETVCHP